MTTQSPITTEAVTAAKDAFRTSLGGLDSRWRAALEAAAPLLAAPLEAEVERLGKLVYVPGFWRCPKCVFTLVQSNLNSRDGTVTARDQPGDKCPNCNSPLWRVTEREERRDVVREHEKGWMRAQEAEKRITALTAPPSGIEIEAGSMHLLDGLAIPSMRGGVVRTILEEFLSNRTKGGEANESR